jgi:hypothetical protein
MIEQDNLTSKQSDYAIFLPAISSFYATFIGNQRNQNYIDPARMPAAIKDMEQLNWLNSQRALFPYRWSLYSAGHANLDLNKQDWSEDMVRSREPGTFLLGDSGGFQIATARWPGEWRAPNSAEVKNHMQSLIAAGPEKVVGANGKTKIIDHVKLYQKKIDSAEARRRAVLKWLDNIADYAMILDIPTWITRNDAAKLATGITTEAEAIEATIYNNEYFINNRKGIQNGGARFLNVLQGSGHEEAEDWYNIMKDYCDPKKYPHRHFDGWAMGGQNMCDVHLILRRLITLRYDNLLQPGVHDWMHFLGTSKLEWAVLLTVLQRAVRKYVNPNFTISFDCASPFLATANGQVYHHIDLPPNGKWTYRMSPSIDNKKYSTDTRLFGDVAMQDFYEHFRHFDDSPVSRRCEIKDVCVYRPGDLNKLGKEGKTSWDSFSYTLQMSHNVWTHIESVQRANRLIDQDVWPKMLVREIDQLNFSDIVDRIFAAPDRDSSLALIDKHSHYWKQIKGTRGGNDMTSNTSFNNFFELA